MSQLSGGCQIALVNQDKDVYGRDLRYLLDERMLTCRVAGLCQNGGRTSHIFLGQFQTGEKQLTGNVSVRIFYLPRQLDALLPVLLSGLQIVPLVA